MSLCSSQVTCIACALHPGWNGLKNDHNMELNMLLKPEPKIKPTKSEMQHPSSFPISQTQAVAAPPGQRNHPEECTYSTPLGIAFVINRALVAPKEAVMMELIKGRALALKFKWHNDNNILLINVYAPNDRNTHPAFWETIDMEHHSKGLRKLDMMLGDCNVTDEPIDRAPAHLDDTNAIAALGP
ncbi:hypothetical protein EI94DRAFT_1695956 [Lactarius quietus]|nr:hypothetical protein EI94DRAFT_1695956 [Lactarius quietus]